MMMDHAISPHRRGGLAPRRTPRAGLFLVGAGTHPGAGMPGVLSSARVLDTVIPDPADLDRVLGHAPRVAV